MRRQKHSDAVLGISVTPNRLEAVLLRPSDQHAEVLGRFSRPRTPAQEPIATASLAATLPGLQRTDETDFTIEVGDGDSRSNLFLSGEFVGLGAKVDVESLEHRARQRSASFVQPLGEILAECRRLGYPQPNVAFCIGAPDVAYVELFVARDQGSSTSRKPWWPLLNAGAGQAGADQRHLLDLLAAKHIGPFDPARVAFLPMTPLLGQRRYLAVVPDANEPVTTTVQAMRRQQGTQAPASRVLGAEVPLYTTLARKTLAPTERENTAVVRVGSDDTLILFLSGEDLRHFERLRSLTTYDPPETICSRVLLQQDEQKIGDIHQVLVLSEGHAELFVDSFRKFYPHAAVEPVHRALLNRGTLAALSEDELPPGSIPALGIGLNLLEAWEKDDAFGAVNLLPKKLRQKQRAQFAYSWHTFAMLLLLFGVTFFFTWRYARQQAEIDLHRAEMQLLNIPNPTMGSATVLQTRVDSLQNAYTRYTHSIQVLDSLLVGSDQWTRTLEKTARATRDIRGIWFDAWQPVGSSIQIKGYATSREQIPRLAYLLGGEVHETSFSDVNEARIYPFTIVVPRPIGIPMVVEYLRENAVAPPAERAPGASAVHRAPADASANPSNQ